MIKSLTYICLSCALIGTLALMGQMTTTGGHVGKGMIEKAVTDFMPREEARLYSATVTHREIACDHRALPVEECVNCGLKTAL